MSLASGMRLYAPAESHPMSVRAHRSLLLLNLQAVVAAVLAPAHHAAPATKTQLTCYSTLI